MKVILSSLITLGICLTSITPILTFQPATAQTENLSEQIEQLRKQAIQQTQQGKPLEAIETLKQLLTIARQQQDRELEVFCLLGLGSNYNSIGQPQKALEQFNQALIITQEVGDPLQEAISLNNIGDVYRNIGQPTEALAYYQQVLVITKEITNFPEGKSRLVARLVKIATLNNIGLVYREIGKPNQALEYHQQVLPITREVGHRRWEGRSLNNIGTIYRDIAKLAQALNYFEQALPILREARDRAVEASTLNNIAAVYHSLGQTTKALYYYEQALVIKKQISDRRGEGIMLNNIGTVYRSMGKRTEALDYFEQVLRISQEVENRSLEASTLNNIGAVYEDIDKPKVALNYYQKSLPISQEIGNRSVEAITMNNIGDIYRNIDQPTEALKYFEQALPILREVGNILMQATTLNNIGLVYRDTDQPTEAIKYLEDAVNITLEMRRNLRREDRKAFLKQEENTAIALIELLIEQNQPEKAFEWANLTTTFDLADYNRLINAQVANPEIQKELDDWNQKNEQLNFLRQQLDEEHSTAKAQQVNELQAELHLQAEDIADQYPEVAELFEIQPTDISILRENIAPDTAIIQPVILSDKIALFILTSEELKVITQDVNTEEFNQLITQYLRELSNHKNPNVYETGDKIYDILIRPIESELKTIAPQNLAIIATGKLRYIPFEALSDTETGEYLLEKYPIHYLTRISTRQIPSNASLQRVEKMTALALANPKPTEENLPGTEKEAQYLMDNFPGSEAYLGTDATLQTFKENASRFRILHLGTHGCFDPEGCEDLGMEANTILFANNEQYNIADAALLGLKDTEILALSACQTAKEANANGRELSGLAFVLERAGAKTVMASLWNAADKVSADIVTDFYTNMKQGMSKNEAMRQAKLSYLKTGKYNHPYFWSPFILIGNN